MKTTISNKRNLLISFGLFCLLTFLLVHSGKSIVHAADLKNAGGLYLVSTGVGDADMITVRALDTIEKSDIIICRPQTREQFSKYLEGKTFWEGAFNEWRTWNQDCSEFKDAKQKEKCKSDRAVREELAAKIRGAIEDGKTVSVLGSGDLMIYGGPYRWYLEAFKDSPPKIIPGVSALNAANAALGKDIMMGKKTSSTVMTVYRDIDKLAKHNPTMIVFTMHTEFDDLVKKLSEYYPPETPIAIVFYAGDEEKEYQVSGSLDTIIQKVEGIDFPFEHLVYVGDFLEN